MATLKPLQAVKWFAKGVLRMGMDGAKIAKRWANKFWRQLKNHLPNFLAASYYNTENKIVLFKDLLSGRLSQTQAVEIANRISWLGKSQQIGNIEWLLKYYFASSGMTDKQIKFLADHIETIQHNKSLRNQLFKSWWWLGNWVDILKPWKRKPFNADMSHLVPQTDIINKFKSVMWS